MCNLCGLYHLIDTLVVGTALGGEGKDGDTRLDAGNILGCLSRANGNLSQLARIGIGHHGTVGEDHQAVGAVGRTLREKHDECT